MLSQGQYPSDAVIITMRVQVELTRLGYYNGSIDGFLGPDTRSSLRAFQRDQTLEETGRMDDQTLSRLGISQ